MINWSTDKYIQFRRDYPVKTNRELCRDYGITLSQVITLGHRLSLEKARPKKQVVWTDEETARFISRYPIAHNKALATDFHISLRTVQRKAKTLGLKKNPILEDMQQKRQAIVSLYDSLSNRRIARRLHVSTKTVSRVAAELGLTLTKAEQTTLRSEQFERAFRYERYCRDNQLSHRMTRPLGFDKKRKNLEYRLTADGYFLAAHSDKVYFPSQLHRHLVRERNAESLGMVFIEYPLASTQANNEGAYTPENIINSSTMIIKGKITEATPVRPVKGRNGQTWDMQQFVLETDDERPQRCAFEVHGDNIAKFNIQNGEHLTVDITMTATHGSKGDWFSHNRAVNVTRQ